MRVLNEKEVKQVGGASIDELYQNLMKKVEQKGGLQAYFNYSAEERRKDAEDYRNKLRNYWKQVEEYEI